MSDRRFVYARRGGDHLVVDLVGWRYRTAINEEAARQLIRSHELIPNGPFDHWLALPESQACGSGDD